MGGHTKFPCTGQRVKVQRSETVLLDRRQGHAEYAVGPLEVMAAHVKVTGQRVEIKVMVLNPPRGVGRETIHDQPVTAKVRDVCERVVASVFGRIHDDVGEERIGRHVGGIERVLSN